MTLVAEGGCCITQDGRSAELGPGDLCLYDSARPYQITVPGPLDALIVMADHRLISSFVSQSRQLCATATGSSDPAGRLAVSFWRQLCLESANLDDGSLARLARAGFDAARGALLRSPLAGSGAGSSAYALHRAQTFMAEQFHLPDLSVADVARAAGLSVRRLQELFQGDGTTIGRHLSNLRLNAARYQLADPTMAHRSIGLVAESVGLPDQAYFSRLFRTAYSMSPRAYRMVALSTSASEHRSETIK